MFGNGTILIRIWAEDLAGNIEVEEIMLRKDILSPEIIIISPSINDTVGRKPPSFLVHIKDSNIHKMWYSIDHGLTRFEFTSNDSINEIAWYMLWDSINHDDVISIQFWANDTVGNCNFSVVNVIKDGNAPILEFEFTNSFLNSTTLEYYHKGLFIICSTINSSDTSSVYFCVNSSGFYVNYSMNSMGNGNWSLIFDISDLNWNDLFTFFFIAADSVGNIATKNNSTHLYTIKIEDFQKPTTIISYNENNAVTTSTRFILTADDNLGSGINLIMYKINDSDWIIYTGSFTLDTYPNGYNYNISYFSIDNAGNYDEIKSIIIYLELNSDDQNIGGSISGYNILIITGFIGIIVYLLIKKQNIKLKRNLLA